MADEKKKYSVSEFAEIIRNKYTGAYDDKSDEDLVGAWLKKYPTYADSISDSRSIPKVEESKRAQSQRPFTRDNGIDENGKTSESSHKMATEIYDGKWYSFPTIFPKEGNTGSRDPKDWIDYKKDHDGAYQEAKKRGEVFGFGDDKEKALKFGEGSWKPKESEVSEESKEPDKKGYETISINGSPVDVRRNDDGEVIAKHPKAQQWKPISEWEESNPDFWKKAVKAYTDKINQPVQTIKDKRVSDYQFKRKILTDEIDQINLLLIRLRKERPKPMYADERGGKSIQKLDDAIKALEIYDEQYKDAGKLISYTEKVQKDYSTYVPTGQEKDIINTSKAAFKQNEIHVADLYLSSSQNKEWVLKTKEEELDKQIKDLNSLNVSDEEKESHKKKLDDLNTKKTRTSFELAKHLKASNDDGIERIKELRVQIDNEEDPDKIEELENEIRIQQGLSDAFFKAKGDVDKYQKEATKQAINNNSDEIVSMLDAIPANATEEEALNIYFQALLSEQQDLLEETNTGTAIGNYMSIFADIFVPRKAYERLAEITPIIRSIAPIVTLNKLPDRLADTDEKALTGNWIEKAVENVGKGFGVTVKEAMKAFLPATAMGDDHTTTKNEAEALSQTIEKLGLKDAVNLVPQEVLEDRDSFDRWTAGWLGEKTGPTMAIMLPMMVGSMAYTKLARLSKPLRALDKIAKTGKVTKGAFAATKATKLGRFGQKAGKSLVRGGAKAIKTGFQYETGGIIFSGNELIADEADFLSGFLGTVGEGGVMVIPIMLSKVFGKNLRPFMELAARFAKKVARPIGGGIGESSEEFLQSTWQIYRDSDTAKQFEEQWLQQFGDRTERFDFFAHTFMMGMAFRGAAQFGEMMADASAKTYFGLSKEEKKQADEFVKKYIQDYEKQQRKEFIGYTAEFDDDNLSILHEDAKAWVEDAKKGKNKSEIKEAEEALKGYEAELKRRKIRDEHSQVKANIEFLEATKAQQLQNKSVLKLKTKAERKKAALIDLAIKNIDEQLVDLNEKMDKARIEEAKATLPVVEFEKVNLQKKISELTPEEIEDYESAKEYYEFSKVIDNPEILEKAKKELIATKKQKLINHVYSLELRDKESNKIIEDDVAKQEEVKAQKVISDNHREQSLVEEHIHNLENKLEEQNRLPNPSESIVKKLEGEISDSKTELELLSEQEKELTKKQEKVTPKKKVTIPEKETLKAEISINVLEADEAIDNGEKLSQKQIDQAYNDAFDEIDRLDKEKGNEAQIAELYTFIDKLEKYGTENKVQPKETPTLESEVKTKETTEGKTVSTARETWKSKKSQRIKDEHLKFSDFDGGYVISEGKLGTISKDNKGNYTVSFNDGSKQAVAKGERLVSKKMYPVRGEIHIHDNDMVSFGDSPFKWKLTGIGSGAIPKSIKLKNDTEEIEVTDPALVEPIVQEKLEAEVVENGNVEQLELELDFELKKEEEKKEKKEKPQVEIKSKKPEDVKESTDKSGYVSIMPKAHKEVTRTTGGGGASAAVTSNLISEKPQVGDVLEIRIADNPSGVKQFITGKVYKHFINIFKNGKQVGGIKYESKEEAAYLKAISEGKQPKALITSVNDKSLSFELVVPKTGAKPTATEDVFESFKSKKPKESAQDLIDDVFIKIDEINKDRKANPNPKEFELFNSTSGTLKYLWNLVKNNGSTTYKGRGAQNLLNTLEKSKDPVIAEIVRLLKPNLGRLENIIFNGQALGSKANSQRIQIGKLDSNNQFNAVFIHELFHSAVGYKIEQLSKGVGTAQELANYEQLKELFEFTKEKAIEEGQDFYALKDVHEFISELFTNKEFFNWANNTQYNNKSVIDQVIDLLAKLFGLKSGSIAHNGFELAFKIADTKTDYQSSSVLANEAAADKILQDKVRFVVENEEFYINNFAELLHGLYHSDKYDVPPSPTSLIIDLKEVLYAHEKYGEAIRLSHIVDANRQQLIKIAKLFKDDKEFLEYESEIEQTFQSSSAQRMSSQRKAFLPLFDQMKEEGVSSPERKIYNISHLPGAEKAFKNEKTLKAFLKRLAKDEPVLAGILNDENLISKNNLLSLFNFSSNTWLIPSISIKRNKKGVPRIINISQKESVTESINTIKKTINNFTYEDSKTTAAAINKMYNDYFSGQNSKASEIRANTPEKQQRAKLDSLYNEFLTKLTGLDWSGYLNSPSTEEEYVSGKIDKPNIIKYMKIGANRFVGFADSKKKARDYFITTPEHVQSESNVVKLVNTARGTDNISFRFRNVDNTMESSLEQSSNFLRSLHSAGNSIDHAEYKENGVTQHLAKNPLNLIKHSGTLGNSNKNVAPVKSMSDYDIVADLAFLFKSGKKSYLQHTGQYSNKNQFYLLEVPKYDNAEKEYRKRYEDLLALDKKKKKGEQWETSYMKHPDQVKDDIGLLEEVVSRQGKVFEDVRSGDRKAFINNMLFNYALNKFDLDYITLGRPSNFKNAIKAAKRAGSAVSPGIAGNVFIENGVGQFNENHVVSNEMNGAEELLDGLQLAMPEWMGKKAISLGDVFSQVDKYNGKYTSTKDVHYDVVEGSAKLDKTNTMDIEPLAQAFPNSVYGKMYAYMKIHGINTITFTSGTKSTTDTVNKLFKGTEFDGSNAPVLSRRNNSNTFMQTNLRHQTEPDLAKQPIQTTANMMIFKSSEGIARFWEKIQGEIIDEMSNYFGDLKKHEVDFKLLEDVDKETLSAFHDYIKSGGNQVNPYYDRLTQKIRSAILTKKVLNKNVNRTTLVEVPVADIGLLGSRPTKDERHVRMPQVNLNINGIRYSSEPMTRKEAMTKIEKNKAQYIDMYDVNADPKLEKIKEWALEDAGDGKVYIPGEVISYVNVPAENLRNHTFARAHKPIPGAGNIIITDRQSQKDAGRDFDGDVRYAESSFKDKNGRPITGIGSKKGLTNHIQRMLQEEFENPANYDMIHEAIDIEKYDYMFEDRQQSETDNLSSNHLFDVLRTRKINLASNIAIGIIQDFSTSYDFIKKHKLQFKVDKNKRKRFSISLFDYKNPNKRVGQLEISGFSTDRFNLIKNDIGNFMNIALDNAQDPRAIYMGINEYTAHMFMTFVASDITIDFKATKEEQQAAIMKRIEQAVAYFNSPIVKRFIELNEEVKSVDNNLEKKDVLKMLKAEFKDSEYPGFNNLRKLSNEVNRIFNYVQMSREFPKSTVDFDMAVVAGEFLRDNKQEYINTNNLFNYNGTDQDSPFISTADKSIDYARENNFSKSLEGTVNSQGVIKRFLNIKSGGNPYIYLTREEYDMILKKMTATLLLDSFDTGQTVDRAGRDLEKYIEENKDKNLFINLLEVNDGVISINENYRNRQLSDDLLSRTHEYFDDLPLDIQEKFLFYSVGKYGVNVTNARGNFANLFSIKFQVHVGDVLADNTKDWMDAKLSDYKIDKIAETIAMSTPALDFKQRSGDNTYKHSPGSNYIDYNVREAAALAIVNKAKGSGLKDVEQSVRDQFKNDPRKLSIVNRIFVEASHFVNRTTKAEAIRDYAEMILSKSDLVRGNKALKISTVVDIATATNHSGGALGSDTAWDVIGKEFGMVNNKHYYFEGNKTPNGNTEIPIGLKHEADEKLKAANKTLGRRFPTSKEYVNNLLRRNWWQVKNSDAVFAISTITNNKVDGGTGWAVHMAIAENKPVFVFDQEEGQWFTWNGDYFVKADTPSLTQNFAGIGTRNINPLGKQAIRDVYEKTIDKEPGQEEKPIEHQLDSINEPLANLNPKLQEFIRKHFQKIFPELKIFESPKAFQNYIRKMNGEVDRFDLKSMGAAFGKAVFIDPNKSVQSTFFHENAHIYWNMLPADNKAKQELVELYGSKEDAIQEIGKIGSMMAENEMNSPFLTKVKNSLRKFWIAVRKFFGKKTAVDPALQFAQDIWANKDNVFSQEEQLGTIEHQKQELDYDDPTHTYKSGDIEFGSATTIIKRLKQEKFNPEVVANRLADAESRRLVEEGENALSTPQKNDFRENKLREWQQDSERGTAGHSIIEKHRKGHQIGDEEKQYFTDEAFEEFKVAIDDYFAGLEAYPNSEVFEEMTADFDSYIAGHIDFQYENDLGNHIRDFKFSKNSKWDGDELSTKYTEAYEGRTLLPPLNNLNDSKENAERMQVNIYNLIKGGNADSLGIIPIKYELNDDDLISKIEFERDIPVNINKKTTQELFDYNKNVTERKISAAEKIASENNYVDGIAKNAEIESITILEDLLPQGVELSELSDNPLAVDRLFKHNRVDAKSMLIDDKGFTQQDLDTYSLNTLLTHWLGGPKPEHAKDDYDVPFMTVEEYNNKFPGALTPFMLTKFVNDSAKSKKIYDELEETARRRGINVLSLLESMSYDQLYHYENRLRGLEEEAAGPLREFINRKLVREIIVNRVSEENSSDFSGYRFSTVLLAEMIQGTRKNTDITLLAKYYMNDRFVTSDHKLVQQLMIVTREQLDKSQAQKIKVNRDIKKIYDSGDIDMNNITEVKRGVKYYKEINDDMTDAEKRLIRYLEDFYGRFNDRHKFIKNHPIASKRKTPPIPVFKHYELKWKWGMFKKHGLNWPSYHKYFKPQPWDSYNLGSIIDPVTFEDYKRNFNVGIDKLSDLKSAYNRAKEMYENDKKDSPNFKPEQTHVKLKNTSQAYNKFESKEDMVITIQGLNSMTDKHFMEHVIPLYKYATESYANTKNMLSVIKIYSTKQIFGGNNEQKSKLEMSLFTVMALLAMKSLALNEMAATINLSIGLVQNWIEAVKLDATGWRAIISTAFFDGVYRISRYPMKSFNILNKYQVVNVADEHGLSKLGKVKETASTASLIYTVIVENILHGISFTGVMDQATWDAHDKFGNLAPNKKHLFAPQKRRATENVTRSAHGDYGTKNYILLNSMAFGKMWTQFRNWMAAYYASRFLSAGLDLNGIVHEPMYRALFNQAMITIYNHGTSKGQKKRIYENVKPKPISEGGTKLQLKKNDELLGTFAYLKREAAGDRINFSEMPKHHQQATGKAIRELVAYGVIMGLLKGYLDDDDEKSLFMRIFSVRFTGDLLMSFDQDSYAWYLQAPSPILTFLVDIMIASDLVARTSIAYLQENILNFKDKPYSDPNNSTIRYQSNTEYGNEGDLKLWNKVIKILPFGSGWYQKKLFYKDAQNSKKKKKKKGKKSIFSSGSI